MLQRPQTIFFLFAAIAAAALFLVPYGYLYESVSDQYLYVQEDVFALVLTIGIVVLSLVNLMLYRNRSLQMKIAGFTIILAVALLIVMLITVNTSTEDYYNKLVSNSYIGSLLAMAALASTIAGYFFIKRDEKLVRSADRFR